MILNDTQTRITQRLPTLKQSFFSVWDYMPLDTPRGRVELRRHHQRDVPTCGGNQHATNLSAYPHLRGTSRVDLFL